MKILKLLTSMFILIGFLQLLNAKNIQNKQFALISYNVIIDKQFRDEIADLESQISTIRSYIGKKQDKLEGKIYDITYPYIEEKLEKKYEIDILPVNSFTEDIKYNLYNYPATSIKKAQELGNSHFYFSISIIVESTIPNTKEAKESILYKNKTSPKITIEIDVYDKIGIIPIGKPIGIGKASTPQRVDDHFLKGIIKPVKEEDISKLGENLMGVLYEAIESLVIDFDRKI